MFGAWGKAASETECDVDTRVVFGAGGNATYETACNNCGAFCLEKNEASTFPCRNETCVVGRAKKTRGAACRKDECGVVERADDVVFRITERANAGVGAGRRHVTPAYDAELEDMALDTLNSVALDAESTAAMYEDEVSSCGKSDTLPVYGITDGAIVASGASG